MTKQGRRTFDARGAVVRRSWSSSAAGDVPSGAPSAPCAILDLVVRQVTPSVRPDDVLSGLRVVADLEPPVPPRVTRLAQGSADRAGRDRRSAGCGSRRRSVVGGLSLDRRVGAGWQTSAVAPCERMPGGKHYAATLRGSVCTRPGRPELENVRMLEQRARRAARHRRRAGRRRRRPPKRPRRRPPARRRRADQGDQPAGVDPQPGAAGRRGAGGRAAAPSADAPRSGRRTGARPPEPAAGRRRRRASDATGELRRVRTADAAAGHRGARGRAGQGDPHPPPGRQGRAGGGAPSRCRPPPSRGTPRRGRRPSPTPSPTRIAEAVEEAVEPVEEPPARRGRRAAPVQVLFTAAEPTRGRAASARPPSRRRSPRRPRRPRSTAPAPRRRPRPSTRRRPPGDDRSPRSRAGRSRRRRGRRTVAGGPAARRGPVEVDESPPPRPRTTRTRTRTTPRLAAAAAGGPPWPRPWPGQGRRGRRRATARPRRPSRGRGGAAEGAEADEDGDEDGDGPDPPPSPSPSPGRRRRRDGRPTTACARSSRSVSRAAPERDARRGAGRLRLDPAGGQAPAPPGRPRAAPHPPADPDRVGVPGPPRGGRPGDGGPPEAATAPRSRVLEDGVLVEHYVTRQLVRLAWSATSTWARCRTCCPAWRRRSSTSAGAATPCSTPARSTGTPPAWRAGPARSSRRSSPATRCWSR